MEIVEKSGNKDVIVIELDLASLASVRKCAAAVIQNEPKLHILINRGERTQMGHVPNWTRAITKKGVLLSKQKK